jgi:putative ABC transport system permease protein
MNAFLTDLRLAVRLLHRSPGFTLAVIIVMALGIGANSAMFTALDQTVIRALPYHDPARLVMVWEDYSSFGVPKQRVSPGTFLDWRRRTQMFSELAAYGAVTTNLSGTGAPEQVFGQRVTSNLIPMLGVPPLVGRTFTPAEEGPEVRAVVISYRLWRRKFAGDRDLVGKTILMNGEPHAVIGVMPPRFDYPDSQTEYWAPFGLSPQLLSRRNSHFLKVVGRLEPGIDVARAQEDMTRVAADLAAEYPATNARVGATVAPLKDEMLGPSRVAFIVLVGAAACVLLIGCANVANLLLARAATRRHDVAVRLALGASPMQVAAGLLTENLLLSAAGAGLGFLVARQSLPALQRLVPQSVAGFVELRLDPRALAFTAAVSIAAAVLFGLAPALQLSRIVPIARSTIGRGNRRLANLLVVAELAIALMLAVGAALLIETLIHLQAVDPGFSSRGILTANLSIPISKYQDAARRRRFYDEVLARVRAMPGTISVGLTSDLPYTSRGNTMSVLIEGQPPPQGVEQDALFRLVSAGYLQTMGGRLREGRLLDERDREGSPPVVVVNATLARQYWSTGDALGHRIDTGTGDGARRWMTIVGVVDDVRERGPDLATKPAVYVPFTQTDITFFQPSEIAVLTSRAPETIAGELRQAVHAIDPEQPVSNLRTMDEIVREELADRAQVLQLLATFAGLALVLAALGTYAVLSYVVSQRTREIGLRLAIGARPQDIVRAMLGYSARLAAAGALVGLGAAAAATRLLTTLLFGVTPLDPRTLAAVAALLVTVALIASYIPTRRAASLDPITALREE